MEVSPLLYYTVCNTTAQSNVTYFQTVRQDKSHFTVVANVIAYFSYKGCVIVVKLDQRVQCSMSCCVVAVFFKQGYHRYFPKRNLSIIKLYCIVLYSLHQLHVLSSILIYMYISPRLHGRRITVHVPVVGSQSKHQHCSPRTHGIRILHERRGVIEPHTNPP